MQPVKSNFEIPDPFRIIKSFLASASVGKIRIADQLNAFRGQKCGCGTSKNNGEQTKRDLFTL